MTPLLVTLLMLVALLPFLSAESTAFKKCNKKIDQVCGSDGVTYNNECLLRRKADALQKDDTEGNATKRLVVSYPGPCLEDVEDSNACEDACVLLHQPVCGSDGKTYSNECRLSVANCERKSKVLVTIKHDGEC